MNIKQLILSAVTLMAIALFGYSLVSSWQEPQVQSQIELYQTDLVLQASAWQELQASTPDAEKSAATALWSPLVGENPAKAALDEYESARKETLQNLATLRGSKAAAGASPLPSPGSEQPTTLSQSDSKPSLKAGRKHAKGVEKLVQELETTRDQLILKLGILQAQQGQVDAALKTWQTWQPQKTTPSPSTAAVLIGLWSQPSQVLPEAEARIQTDLSGWFRYRALSQLYQRQQRFDNLARLQNQAQIQAEAAIGKLLLVGLMPTLGLVVGVGLLLWVVIQRIRKGKNSLLAAPLDMPWVTPWTGEIIWQVFIVTFFVLGQIVIPIAFAILGWKTDASQPRSYGYVILGNYLFFSLGGLLILWLSIRSFRPLVGDWFRLRLRPSGFLWGLGGYLVAIPLVVVVSIFNQLIWQGRGGSNPLLPIALNDPDPVVLGCFYFTAAIAAPIFEEIMFRGFLLPSLTKYLPLGGAIGLSSLIFALAHLSLSEVLPLTILGTVLGVVYTRSRNLLSPMLLHSLWNSGTLITLFLLGSGIPDS